MMQGEQHCAHPKLSPSLVKPKLIPNSGVVLNNNGNRDKISSLHPSIIQLAKVVGFMMVKNKASIVKYNGPPLIT